MDTRGLAHYISRPDLQAPLWNITVHRNDLIRDPGVWFVAPYKSRSGEESDQSWVGPFIYNGTQGELIWSGGAQYDQNVEDFRISVVEGEHVMTMMTDNHAFVVDNQYDIVKRMDDLDGPVLNTHELNFNEDGTRAIIIRTERKRVLWRENDFVGDCWAVLDGFVELDTTNEGWPRIFDWRPDPHINLGESTYTQDPVEVRCRSWDFMHANSVDKTPDGNYLFSARHTDTIYKISGRDGSIIWRLGGVRSDFLLENELLFSRQHNVRSRGGNETHLLLSMLDNAKGEDSRPPTWPFSRGLLLAIDERNMEASLQQQYDHPSHDWAPRRGNYQQLPNGNIFMGWSERAAQSEYTSEGALIWDAVLQSGSLGSYRNYKFLEFAGRPTSPPVATAVVECEESTCVTTAHVSWNGATEVMSWVLYKSDGQKARRRIASASKQGFETMITYPGYAKYVIVAARDRADGAMRETDVVTSTLHGHVSAKVLADEEKWLEAAQRGYSTPRTGALIAKCVGLFVIVFSLARWFARRNGRKHRYRSVLQQDIPLEPGVIGNAQ